MNERRGPHTSAKCPFYVLPDDPLSAEASVNQCVRCVTRGNARLEGLSEDFRQLAFLTILEETPKFDPAHPSRASFITFIKSRVCSRLWAERRKELKYLPCPQDEEQHNAEDFVSNPLVDCLVADACACESMEDTIIQQIEVEQLREHLPQLLEKLSKKEREVLRLKYFEVRNSTGVEIARALSVSEGRVSQLTKSALTKLKKAFLAVRSDACFEKTKDNH